MSSRGPKNRAVGAGAALVGALAFLRRRHRRLHNSAIELHDTVVPAGVDEPVRDDIEASGQGHAAGHRHLPPPQQDHTAVRGGWRVRRYSTGNRSRTSRS